MAYDLPARDAWLYIQGYCKNLNVDASTVWRRVKQFQEEASVAAAKNEGNHKMTDLEQFAILEAVLKNPGICVKFSDMLRPSLG